MRVCGLRGGNWGNAGEMWGGAKAWGRDEVRALGGATRFCVLAVRFGGGLGAGFSGRLG